MNTPFGYRIKNAKAVVFKNEAEKIKVLFDEYSKNGNITKASQISGINKFHGTVGRMLGNRVYLGTDFYPQIISEELFSEVQGMRAKRTKALGRDHKKRKETKSPKPKRYVISYVEQKHKDPFRQAEYAYSKIKEIVCEG